MFKVRNDFWFNGPHRFYTYRAMWPHSPQRSPNAIFSQFYNSHTIQVVGFPSPNSQMKYGLLHSYESHQFAISYGLVLNTIDTRIYFVAEIHRFAIASRSCPKICYTRPRTPSFCVNFHHRHIIYHKYSNQTRFKDCAVLLRCVAKFATRSYSFTHTHSRWA